MPKLLPAQLPLWLAGPGMAHRRPAQPRNFYGAGIFGAGFGLCGTCPGGAMAMVATGGLLVPADLVAGLWLRGLTEGMSWPRITRPLPVAVPTEPES